MLSLNSSLTLSRALKRSVNVPYSKLLLSSFKPNDTFKWQDVLSKEVSNPYPLVLERSEEEDSYMGYRLQGVRVVRRVEDSEDPLPILEEGDVLFYLLVDGLKATEEIKEMGAVRVKFFESEGLKEIGDNFMGRCVTLREVSFGKFNSLKSIGGWMFFNCISLEAVSFEGLEGVKTIGNAMFSKCTSLETVSFKGLDGAESIGYGMFYNCTLLGKVSFQGLEGLKSIGDWMFSRCTSLKTVSFQGLECVETIGDQMFSSCTSLKTVSFEGLNPKVHIKDKIYKGKFLS
jgi:hypothetical protein